MGEGIIITSEALCCTGSNYTRNVNTVTGKRSGRGNIQKKKKKWRSPRRSIHATYQMRRGARRSEGDEN